MVLGIGKAAGDGVCGVFTRASIPAVIPAEAVVPLLPLPADARKKRDSRFRGNDGRGYGWGNCRRAHVKLASLKSGRDGKLVVVSNDLAWYADAGHIAPTLQAALDDWERVLPDLQNLAIDLEHETIPMQRFHETKAAAPLPRAYQWADGSAYVNHVALVRQARGAEMPETFWHDPLMYQGGSDGFLGPREAISLADEALGCDFEGEVVVVTGDVAQGASREEALAAVRLVGLTNDVSLRNLIPGELAKGF
eukprot:gene21633-22556_t